MGVEAKKKEVIYRYPAENQSDGFNLKQSESISERR